MEFFRTVNSKITEADLQKQLTLRNLKDFSNEIFTLEEPEEQHAQIGGLWGDFTLSRSEIKGGLRFSLVECPNALCWTITTGYPPATNSIVIHLTINRQEKEEEFIEEISDFLDDMAENIKMKFETLSFS